jgi:hypothetical protein
MWKQFWTAGICVIVTVVAASAQGTSPSERPANTVLIGCLEGAQSGYTLRDYRSGTQYRIEGTAEMLGWHVGHELELHGTLQAGGQMLTLKVETVVYISPTCSQTGKPSS